MSSKKREYRQRQRAEREAQRRRGRPPSSDLTSRAPRSDLFLLDDTVRMREQEVDNKKAAAKQFAVPEDLVAMLLQQRQPVAVDFGWAEGIIDAATGRIPRIRTVTLIGEDGVV